MKGYEIFAFTPSGKSLKKTLLPSRPLTVQTIITRVFKLPTEKASLIVTTCIFQNMILLTSWGIIATVLPEFVLKTSYFGLILIFKEKQSEYLVIGGRFKTCGMNYSHEILASF